MLKNITFYSLTVFIWGSTWIAIKYQLGSVDPLLSVIYRFALASGLIFLYCGISGRAMRFTRKDHVFMVLQGICLFALNYWLVYLSELYLTSGLVAVMFSTIVFFNIINGYFFLKTPVSLKVFCGAVLGILGIGLVFWPELSGFNFDDTGFKGLVLIIGGTAFASLGNIISSRNQKNGVPVVQNNAFSMAYGSGFMFIIALITNKAIVFDTSFLYLSSLFYLVVFGSIVAFGCYLTLIGRLGAARASYANLVFPIVALIISTLFEGYQWSGMSIAGVSIILTGNFIALTSLKFDGVKEWVRIRIFKDTVSNGV